MRCATVIAVLLSAAVASAQESDADRLRKLEERVQKQQEEIDQLKKSKPGEKAPAPALSGSLSDGLRFKTDEGNIDIHVGGRFQEHYRDTFNRPDSPRTTPDTFFIRAARIKVDGTFYKDYGFQVEGDFPSSLTGPTPTLQAAFVEWKKHKEFRLMFGQFKAPMSQERLRSRLFSDFVEDSMLTRFVPGYDIGIQSYGSLSDGFMGYQVAFINGRSHLDNAGRLRNDDNDAKEGVARVTLSPWAPDKESLLKGLRVGAAGSITRSKNVPIVAAGAAPALPTNFDLITPELGVTMLDPTGAAAVNFNGRRTRINGELSYAVGPVCLRSEYLLRKDEVVSGALHETVPTTAWSATFTWILTGEEKLPETRITPAHPFDLEGGWGAVELAFRVADARVSNRLGDVGVNLAGQSLEVTSYSAGVNWWLTRNVRVSADVVREDYHGDINFGAAGNRSALLGFLARFQIDF